MNPASDRPPLALIVDDDADILALVSARLKRSGFEVAVAHNGVEALALAQARTPDVAVVDLMMGDMGGHELVRRLRARAATATMPVLVLTAAVHDGVAEEAATAGADDHMAKPFSPRELVERLEALLGRERAYAPGEDGYGDALSR